MDRTELIELLERRTGMTVASLGGERSLTLSIQHCTQASGFESVSDWMEELTLSAKLWEAFVHEVIVPETFFFRYPESFHALTSWVKSNARPSHPLRILSLPCSTGEEAYSIAITLREAGLGEADFSITAADLDRRSVEFAERGEYRRGSSFRSNDENYSRDYFVHKLDDHLVIADSIRKHVTFQTHNLWEMSPDAARWDILFCRNLLIYFSEENQIAALAKLTSLLQTNGLLFLGPAEVPVAAKHGWQSAGYPMAFACRKREEKTSSCHPCNLPPRRVKPPSSAPQTSAQLPRLTQPTPITESTLPSLTEIRSLADKGSLSDANASLESYLQRSPTDAEALTLRGLLFEIAGESDRAENAFRQAIYLDPANREALAHLATLLETQGRLAASRKLLERAERMPSR